MSKKLLTREEEARLARAWQKRRDARSRDALVQANIGLVVYAAQKFLWSGQPLEDLVQVAFLGLLRALETFNPSKGRLTTYATPWMTAMLRRHVDINRGGLSLGDGQSLPAKLPRLEYLERKRLREAGKEATDSAIAEGLGMTMGRLEELRRIAYGRYLSLDAPLVDDGTFSFGDTVSAEEDNPEQMLIEAEQRSIVRRWMSGLKRRDRIIAQGMFMNGRTLKEVGDFLGLSRERIRQIKERLMRELRRLVSRGARIGDAA